MLVEKRMTTHPISVSPLDTLQHATALIRERGIHHLPVVEAGRLVGLVTDRDLRQASPSPATSLEMHELHYLLDKVQVREIMAVKLYTVAPDTPIEEAARLMLEHGIGCLPVLQAGSLRGIITRTDILRAFVELTGLLNEQARLELVLEDRPGAFLDICRIIQEQGGDIAGLVTGTATHQGQEKRVVILRLEGVRVDPLVAHLEAAGHTVLSTGR